MTPSTVPVTSGSRVISGSVTEAGMNGWKAGTAGRPAGARSPAAETAAAGASPPEGSTMATRSVHRVRDGEGERRDDGVEALAVLVDHAIGALHRADRGRQRAEAGVLAAIAATEDRLVADHPGPLHPLHLAIAIGDDPLAADQLHRLAVEVGDADAVGEEVVVLLRRAALGVVEARHLDADAASHRVAHRQGIIGVRRAQRRAPRAPGSGAGS